MAKKGQANRKSSISGGTPRGLRRGGGTASIRTLGQTTRAGEKFAPVAGRPGVPQLVQQFPRVLKPVFRRRGIRTLIKVDPAIGISTKDSQTLPGTKGVVGPGRGGYKGVMVIAKSKIVGAARNQRVVKVPSPTSGAGVRSPYNAKRRVGRRGNNKRFGG